MKSPKGSRKAKPAVTEQPAAVENGKPAENHVKSSDDEHVMEFGGPIGVTAMMIGFPILMYYLWICCVFYKGGFFRPADLSLHSLQAFGNKFLDYVLQHAAPTVYGFQIYLGFCLMQFILAATVPGPVYYGFSIPSEGNKKLPYLCNGVGAFYGTIILAYLAHVTKIFPITDIVDYFGEIMTAAIVTGFVVTFITYFATVMWGKPYRMSGNFIYDLFMGATLNPRIGPVDLKMWAEIRIPWPVLFFVTVSAAVKQYEQVGYLPATMIFLMYAHFLYCNACQKGEEFIPTTWDIFYEKWGFMLIFWNLAGVPFTYCLCSLYALHAGPIIHHPLYTGALFVILSTAYYIWDTCMSQKCSFRAKASGIYVPRGTFPQLPWRTLENPKCIETASGSALLIDGWWKYARKVHYTSDYTMCLTWALITGVESAVPFFYPIFFFFVLTHRSVRDMQRCARKYGNDWERYCKEVPYIFIPGII